MIALRSLMKCLAHPHNCTTKYASPRYQPVILINQPGTRHKFLGLWSTIHKKRVTEVACKLKPTMHYFHTPVTEDPMVTKNEKQLSGAVATIEMVNSIQIEGLAGLMKQYHTSSYVQFYVLLSHQQVTYHAACEKD